MRELSTLSPCSFVRLHLSTCELLPDTCFEHPRLPDTVGGLHIKERCSTIDADPDQNVWQTLASEWLRECGTHELCAQVEEDMELPTRVIDVASGVNPRLALSAGKRGKFMALSYCWGPQGDDLLVLNDATKTSLLEGRVEETAFARTHREAFAVARALGIQFVWIDALCIIQKNREDWEAESKRMAIVYNNAYLTVLAGSSTDSRAGFLAGRSSPAQPFPIPLDDSSRDRSPFLFATLKRSRTEGPTRTRSWCFQESMLSRRLLIFGPEQLMFKCITGDCFEHEEYKKMNGVHLTLEDQKTCLFHPNQQQLRLQPGSTSAVRYAVLEHWYIMLIEFTNRRLSNPDDIFASISSLAQTAALYLRKSRYLAGLWEEDIVRGLLWRPGSFGGWEPVELARPRSWMAPGPVVRAPTWSWAAVEGCIDHLDYEPGGGETMVMGGKSKSGGIPHGTRVRDSVFRTKPGFVRVRPAVRFSQGENDETFCWSEDMHCRPDVLHMPSCELRMWGRLVKADFSEQQVNLRRWEPSFDWRPEEQRYRSNAFNGSRYVFERALMIYAYGFYLVDGEDEGKKFAIGLFDVKEETCREVWCLQLTEIEGLMLREVQGDDGTRRYQRLGLFWLEQKSWFDNVDEVEVRLI